MKAALFVSTDCLVVLAVVKGDGSWARATATSRAAITKTVFMMDILYTKKV